MVVPAEPRGTRIVKATVEERQSRNATPESNRPQRTSSRVCTAGRASVELEQKHRIVWGQKKGYPPSNFREAPRVFQSSRSRSAEHTIRIKPGPTARIPLCLSLESSRTHEMAGGASAASAATRAMRAATFLSMVVYHVAAQGVSRQSSVSFVVKSLGATNQPSN